MNSQSRHCQWFVHWGSPRKTSLVPSPDKLTSATPRQVHPVHLQGETMTDGNTRLSWWVNEDGGPLNMMMRFLAKKRHMRIIIVKYWQAATVTINYSVLCFGSIFAVIRHELLSVQLCAKRNQCLVQRSVLIISEDINFNTRSSSSRRSFQAPNHDLCCCTVDLRFLTHPKRYDKCAKVRQGTASELHRNCNGRTSNFWALNRGYCTGIEKLWEKNWETIPVIKELHTFPYSAIPIPVTRFIFLSNARWTSYRVHTRSPGKGNDEIGDFPSHCLAKANIVQNLIIL